MADYNVTEAFDAIENELISSMIRNMERHKAEELEEGFEWAQWQAEQLSALEQYRRNNMSKFSKKFSEINSTMSALIAEAKSAGGMDQEIKILDAIKNGFKTRYIPADTLGASWFATNDRKLNALLKSVENDMQKAETAILRKANDEYRKAIFNAQVYANTGAGTYEQAIDMATKDMLKRGLTCVKYANGAIHTLKDYADMALRTAAKRAYLQGEGEKREEWGIHTVILNKRGDNPCPQCLPWVGKVMIDDVWGGGTSEEAKETGYPLMSTAVAGGLYHPRCKDSHTTYFPGISSEPDKTYTKEELQEVKKNYTAEQQKAYAERQAKSYKRLAENSLDPSNKQKYSARQKEWEKKAESISVPEESGDAVQTRLEDYAKSLKTVANSGKDGTIKSSETTISSLESIERNTEKGKAAAITHYDVDLNNRQQSLLDKIPEFDSRTIVRKSDVSMSDLAAMTAKTGDEFAMFTKGNERLIIRGNSQKVNVSREQAEALAAEGYRWSGHTHPGADRLSMLSSPGDREILKAFNQERSVIYNSTGEYNEFWRE